LAQIIENNMFQYALAMARVVHGYMHYGYEATSPLVLIRFLADEPVYRTIHTVAHRKDAFSKNRDTISKVFFYK
jgi:hypothetical protein